MSWSHSELVTEVYDLDKPVGHSYGDVEYYVAALGEAEGRVIELAVGTGRILVPLLRAGIDAEGADLAPEMIERCRQNCTAAGFNPVLHVESLQSFRRPDFYAAVAIPSGSIRNAGGHEETLEALDGCRASLVAGGELIVDLAPPLLVHPSRSIRTRRRGTTLWTTETTRVEFDAAANRMTEFCRYEKWTDGELVRSELHIYELQQWTLREFDDLLTRAGFVDVRVTADYRSDRQPGARNNDWTFHARRPALSSRVQRRAST